MSKRERGRRKEHTLNSTVSYNHFEQWYHNNTTPQIERSQCGVHVVGCCYFEVYTYKLAIVQKIKYGVWGSKVTGVGMMAWHCVLVEVVCRYWNGV